MAKVHSVTGRRVLPLVEGRQLSATPALKVKRADVRSHLDEKDGVLALELQVEWSGAPKPEAVVEAGGHQGKLRWITETTLRGDVRIENVDAWWPHTHGKPALHALRVRVGDCEVDLGRVGFRALELDDGPDGRGFALRVNGEPVFCRGALWAPEPLEPGLWRLRDAGMNLVRVSGTYESDAFFALCDELGILVWQDFVFAQLDSSTDAAFREADQLLDRVQTSPALAVLCGGSDVEQQVLRLRPDVPYVAAPGRAFHALEAVTFKAAK